METRIVETARRIKGMREMLGISVEDMAELHQIPAAEYEEFESGNRDFGFTFLYNCADRFGIDIVELLTGENPKLSHFSIVRKGKGLDIKRREGFKYEHLGYRFKNKKAEVFLVTAPFNEAEQNKEIALSRHKGQEFDYVISGSLKIAMEDHTDILHEGDSIYYDSGRGHGMIACGGKPCTFIAVVIHE